MTAKIDRLLGANTRAEFDERVFASAEEFTVVSFLGAGRRYVTRHRTLEDARKAASTRKRTSCIYAVSAGVTAHVENV